MQRYVDDHHEWVDRGCSVAPHCLQCPLPRCRYEVPGGLRAIINEARDRQMVELRRGGVPVEMIATTLHVSRRTVFRCLREQRAPARVP